MTEVGQKCLGCAPGVGPSRRRSQVLPLVLALGAVVALVSAVFYVGSDSFQKSGTSRSTAKAEPVALGALATDEHVTFAVRRLECATGRLDVNGKPPSPGGHFCFLTVMVRNDRLVNVRLNSGLQFLADAAGVKYQMDDIATFLYAQTTPTEFGGLDNPVLPSILPGQATTLVLVFDLPQQVRITEAELHASGLGVRMEVTAVTATTTTSGRATSTPGSATSPSGATTSTPGSSTSSFGATTSTPVSATSTLGSATSTPGATTSTSRTPPTFGSSGN